MSVPGIRLALITCFVAGIPATLPFAMQSQADPPQEAKQLQIAWNTNNGTSLTFGISLGEKRTTFTLGEEIQFVFHAKYSNSEGKNDKEEPMQLSSFGVIQAIYGDFWPLAEALLLPRHQQTTPSSGRPLEHIERLATSMKLCKSDAHLIRRYGS